jgi:hypothetical protein
MAKGGFIMDEKAGGVGKPGSAPKKVKKAKSKAKAMPKKKM